MELDEYQLKAAAFAVYPPHTALYYTAMGLAGEAGEYAGKISKALRRDPEFIPKVDEAILHKEFPMKTQVSFSKRDELLNELGDVLWYVAECSKVLGASLQEVADMNLKKLAKRLENGTIKGEGDHR